MGKHFTMPPELEKYNPETYDYALDLGTFDTEGSFHSYADNPSYGRHNKDEEFNLYWHCHGQLYREDDKPTNATFSNGYYETRDAQGELHSEGDKPSSIIHYREHNIWRLQWHSHGTPHRENGLPVFVAWRLAAPNDEEYMVNGVYHRANSLPAKITRKQKTWLVLDELHNAEGAAIQHTASSKGNEWCLYGVGMPESTFDAIINLHHTKNVPLWAAFLCELGFFDETALDTLKDESYSLDTNLPIAWFMRLCGITEKSFTDRISKMTSDTQQIGFRQFFLEEVNRFENFLKVATYEANLTKTEISV